jgi:RimJ/RimL family protein N-acetyltransferase
MADSRFSILRSERLVLRRLRQDDLSTFCEYRSDPRVAQYQDWTTFPEEEGVRFLAEHSRLHPDVEGTWFQFAIGLGVTGQMIGDCGLKTLGDHPGQVEIGFTLAPAYHGKGYATEAVTRLLDYVFGELCKHRVTAVTDARNVRAVRLLERVGMRREGHFIHNVWFKGSWGDEYLYALVEQEWFQLRGSSGP